MSHPYDNLTPDLILDLLEGAGWLSDARILPLNSYENRVYQIGLEDGSFVVAKFYRPARWTDAAILEEHVFTRELADYDLPVVAPIERDGTTLFEDQGFRFAVYPRQGGRAPATDDMDALATLGRFLGRIHRIGAIEPFHARESLSIERLGDDSVRTIVGTAGLPDYLETRYADTANVVLDKVRSAFAETGQLENIRVHGDCHLGNVLWRDDAPHFVDFDDAINGPAIQDLWMLLSGSRGFRQRQLLEIIEGYEAFHTFDPRELRLVEPLRALRMLHHAAWLARRWDDPAFPPAFPWFGTDAYWAEQIGELEQQSLMLDEPPLSLYG